MVLKVVRWVKFLSNSEMWHANASDFNNGGAWLPSTQSTQSVGVHEPSGNKFFYTNWIPPTIQRILAYSRELKLARISFTLVFRIYTAILLPVEKK